MKKPSQAGLKKVTKNTEASLLEAAKKVFARKGYDGATVKELAEAAGVNVSLVSYHFDGKDGLYRACLENFGRGRLAAAERVLKDPQSLEDFRVRLQLFAEEFLNCHLQEPEITSILHRECSVEKSITKDLFKGVFFKVFETLTGFVENGQKRGFLRSDLNPHVSCMLFMGGLIHSVRMDSLSKENFGVSLSDPPFRDLLVTHALRNLIEGIAK